MSELAMAVGSSVEDVEEDNTTTKTGAAEGVRMEALANARAAPKLPAEVEVEERVMRETTSSICDAVRPELKPNTSEGTSAYVTTAIEGGEERERK